MLWFQSSAFLITTFVITLQNAVAEKEHVAHGVHNPLHETHYQGSEHNIEFDHEAVLGSEKANQEFAELPPHEAKKRLATMVDAMDEDKNGVISEEELTVWITKSYQNLYRDETLRKMFTQDPNRDGQISWEEYLMSVYNYEPQELEDLEIDKNPDIQSFYLMIEEDKNRFLRADLNGDRKLDIDEYTAFLHPNHFPHMQEYELDRTLAQYDRNKDSFVDFKEYVGDSPGSKEMQLVDKENFDHYDANGDGRLSREELRTWVLPDMKDSVKEEVEHLFAETDINKDGKLTKDEILDMHYFWVGSAVTDYGADLHKHDPQEL